MSDAKRWNLRPDGNVYLPMVEKWWTAGMGLAVGLRLETGSLPEGLTAQPQELQMGLSTTQARSLGQALLDAADRLDRKQKGRA